MIVLDTNVVSELMRPAPSAAVSDWVTRQPRSELRTSAVTVAEVRHGLERLSAGRRKDSLVRAAAEIFAKFSDDILPFDADAAQRYAGIVSHRERIGLPISAFDAQVAAICQVRGAALATRNLKDFEETGIRLIDPWQR